MASENTGGERKCQVAVALDVLTRVSTVICDEAHALETRLAVVLTEGSPTTQPGKEAEPDRVPLAARLMEIAESIEGTVEHIKDILRRLEL